MILHTSVVMIMLSSATPEAFKRAKQGRLRSEYPPSLFQQFEGEGANFCSPSNFILSRGGGGGGGMAPLVL